ncbi:uncharacterized protein [Callorhinus ursinus]|uniref:uncharacterized protein n=1 Tax=Callorhinus ursinus TaxID=34884 RepID=UPI003CD0404C
MGGNLGPEAGGGGGGGRGCCQEPTPHPPISDRLCLFLTPKATRWRRVRRDLLPVNRELIRDASDVGVGGEPRDAGRGPLCDPCVSPPGAPAPPRRTRRSAEGGRRLSRPLAQCGLSGSLEDCAVGIGRGGRAPSAPLAASSWEGAEGRGWCAAGGPAGPGVGAGRAGDPHGGRSLALPRALPAECLPSSDWRREDPGRDAAATALVSSRLSSGGERRSGKMLEVLVLKRSSPVGPH